MPAVKAKIDEAPDPAVPGTPGAPGAPGAAETPDGAAPGPSDDNAPSLDPAAPFAITVAFVLRAPADVSSCSIDGTEYMVDEGLVEVDAKHVDVLLTLGFSR